MGISDKLTRNLKWGLCLTIAAAGFMSAAQANETSAPAAPTAVKGQPAPPAAEEGAEVIVEGPRIIFEQKDFNFGVLHNDQQVSHIFKFKNIGNKPLVIENVKTGCGCTSTVLGEKEIASGGSGQIEVKFNSRGKKGHQRQTVQVKTNDPVAPTTNLTIQMEVKRDITVKPQSAYLGNLADGETKNYDVTISSIADTMEITEVKSSSPNLTYTLSEPKKNEKTNEKEWTLTVKLLAKESPQNMQRETITLVTNHEAVPRIDIPVQARVVGDITVSPTLLNYGVLKPNQTMTRDARIMSRSGAEITVDRVETNGLPVKVEFTDEMDGKIKKLTAEITAPDLPNQVRGNIDVFYNGHKDPLKLYVMGQVRQEAAAAKPAVEESNSTVK